MYVYAHLYLIFSNKSMRYDTDLLSRLSSLRCGYRGGLALLMLSSLGISVIKPRVEIKTGRLFHALLITKLD